MKMLITTLLLVSSFAVSARTTDRSEANAFKGRVINIFNYNVDLKCNAAGDTKEYAEDALNELARTEVVSLAVEPQTAVTVEMDDNNSFDSYLQLRAVYDTNDNAQKVYEAKLFLTKSNKNIYKMDFRIKKYRSNDLLYTTLITCINTKL